MVWIGRFEKPLEVISRLPRLMLEIVLDGSDMFLVGAICFLVVIVVAAGSNCDLLGSLLLPLFAALGAFLSAFAGGFGRCPRLLPRTVFSLPWMKMFPTASSLDACQVAVSSSSFVVFD
jgi:hypothetical protein